MTSPHPTPPAGLSLRRRRGWVPLAALTVLAGATLALVVSLIGPGGGPGSAGDGGGAIAVTATSFDPEANPAEENESAAIRAVDGDPSTTWATERYVRRPFAGLKEGVGLILRASEPADFTTLLVESPSEDWAAAIYVAEQPSSALAGWGTPVATQSSIGGDATFDLKRTSGRAVLVWITNTGTDRRVVVREARLEGRR